MGVVDVQQRSVAARHLREGAQVGRVAGHAVDPVHAHQAHAVPIGGEQLVEVPGVLEAKAAHRGATRARHLAAVVDRLVCARVQKDRPRGRQHRNHRGVDVRDRGEHKRVLAAQQLAESSLDLLIQRRAAEQARPAGVRPPGLQVGGHRVDDLAIQIEAEVVAGGEVRKPVLSYADHAPIDLVDHGIHHRMARAQVLQIADAIEPVIDPASAGASGCWEQGRRHPPNHRTEPEKS